MLSKVTRRFRGFTAMERMDVVVVNANPLEEFSALWRICWVFVDGAAVIGFE